MPNLIRTLAQICLLRKGPDELPHAMPIMLSCAAIWFFSPLARIAAYPNADSSMFFYWLFSGLVGLVMYLAILVANNRGDRIYQSVSAIIGCSGIIALVALVAELSLRMPLGQASSFLIARFIDFWQVPVEGHIIARAIDRHWYVGFAIGLTVYITQYLSVALVAAPN